MRMMTICPKSIVVSIILIEGFQHAFYALHRLKNNFNMGGGEVAPSEVSRPSSLKKILYLVRQICAILCTFYKDT